MSSLCDKLNSASGWDIAVHKQDFCYELARIYQETDLVSMKNLIVAYKRYLNKRYSALSLQGWKDQKSFNLLGRDLEELALSNLDVAALYADQVIKGSTVFEAEQSGEDKLYQDLPTGPVRFFYQSLASYQPSVQLPEFFSEAYRNEVYFKDLPSGSGFSKKGNSVLMDGEWRRKFLVVRRADGVSSSSLACYLNEAAGNILAGAEGKYGNLVQIIPLLPKEIRNILAQGNEDAIKNLITPYLPPYVEKKVEKRKVKIPSCLEIYCASVPLSILIAEDKKKRISLKWYHCALNKNYVKNHWSIRLPYQGNFPSKNSIHAWIDKKIKDEQKNQEMKKVVDCLRSNFFLVDKFYSLRDFSKLNLYAAAVKTLRSLQQNIEAKEREELFSSYKYSFWSSKKTIN